MNFAERVYEVTRRIPKGRVATYRLIGEVLGTRAYQAIGQSLKKNPYAPEVPCHRVIASNLTLGGFMGKRSGEEIEIKKKLLEEEGVTIFDGRVSAVALCSLSDLTR